jgi:hypothetical protein
MKKTAITLLFISLIVSLHAQDSNSPQGKGNASPADTSHWRIGGVGGFNFAQTSYTNWAAGGEDALSGTGITSLFANYLKGKTSWDNTLDMAYGKTELGHGRPRKSDDKIDLASKYGRYAFADHWYYSGLFNFKSQFDNGYNYPNDTTVVSRFMAPTFFVLSIGLDYKIKDYFSLFIGPVTAKVTVVNDQTLADAGSYGVQKATYDNTGRLLSPGKKHLEEFGGYVKVAFKKDVMKNVNLATKLELFSNYLKDPQNIVVNWETLIAMRINKYISANVSTQLMYDDKVNTKILNPDKTYKVNGPRVQFKEVLSIGISYKFNRRG